MQAQGTPHPAEARFWKKVTKTGDCWLWTGTKVQGTHGGGPYGQFHAGGGRPGIRIYAHRYAWERLRGVIPVGHVLDHTCENTLCVNPDHLEPVTEAVNLERGSSASALNALKTHCKHGHELVGENLHIRRNGKRSCKTCQRDRVRAAYWKGREAA